ncbi:MULTISPECIES: hypothetical protein [Cetobacterium]|uniref:Uncharacterized protein n=1 Tax=Cetobacterium somerae ATCC BAA-474 TaxID=1319815 RepID=U7V806_9FUSO|nr:MULTISPECIES: hypothetical protein [Cetobacterium]ERT66928.1 hypothetical protein HMPREF0202_02491 [Cetobacterium somerae ATCC BAA-474]MCX3066374.1 hypothetical protein [Cetobacterium somerae]WVJ01288.1 hypothetical protein VSU16_00835 [Cetobacterium somerae]
MKKLLSIFGLKKEKKKKILFSLFLSFNFDFNIWNRSYINL